MPLCRAVVRPTGAVVNIETTEDPRAVAKLQAKCKQYAAQRRGLAEDVTALTCQLDSTALALAAARQKSDEQQQYVVSALLYPCPIVCCNLGC